MLMRMEYAGAIRTMVVDELAEVNERVLAKVDKLLTKAETGVQEQEGLDACLEAEREKVNNLEVQIIELEREYLLLHQEVQSAKMLASKCILQMGELMTEVQAMHLLNTVCQHGPANPIVVEDDEEVEETVAESDLDENQVVFLDARRLVPIKDKDLRDAAQEVERAEEREELRCHHLTMDNQAFQEAMEMEWAACIDPVPGYHPAPEYFE